MYQLQAESILAEVVLNPNRIPMYAEVVGYHQIFEATPSLIYYIPEHLRGHIHIGSFVKVPFGEKYLHVCVINFTDKSEIPIEKIKSLASILEEIPRLSEKHISIIKNASQYYFCSIASILKLFCPPAILAQTQKPNREYYYTFQSDKFNELFPCITRKVEKDRFKLLSRLFQEQAIYSKEVLGDKGVSLLFLKRFIDVGILEEKSEWTFSSSVQKYKPSKKAPFLLAPEQKIVCDEILANTSQPHIFYGVTGSGKTEVFIEIIRRIFARFPEKQVLVLVPEIGLTPQLISRFRDHFDDIALWHSRLTSRQKFDEWYRVSTGKARILIGSRSALCVPMKDMGAIILDEEHDESYQQDNYPQYEVHTMTQFFQKEFSCHLVWASGTPRFDHLTQTLQKKAQLSQLKSTFHHIKKPHIRLVSLRDARLEEGSLLSLPLRQAIEARLQAHEKTLLFLNRRGFSPVLLCADCGWKKVCLACDIAMTYHQTKTNKRFFSCHVCGDYQSIPYECPDCKSVSLMPLGVGTQRIEEEIQKAFPRARILRMDQDTITTPQQHRNAYEQMINGEYDIILGTQMVSKGLDIPGITLVGVLMADYGLLIPDFRAEERTIQLLLQVFGRTGRHQTGEIIIQTYQPEHVLFQDIFFEDVYKRVFLRNINERKKYLYPPFVSLIRLEVSHKELEKAKHMAQDIASKLKHSCSASSTKILGPSPSLTFKIKNKYHYQISIKIEKEEKNLFNFLKTLSRDWKIIRDPLGLSI